MFLTLFSHQKIDTWFEHTYNIIHYICSFLQRIEEEVSGSPISLSSGTNEWMDLRWWKMVRYGNKCSLTEDRWVGQNWNTYCGLAWLYSAFKQGSIITKRICSQLSKSNSFRIFVIIKNFWISLGNFRGFTIFDFFFYQQFLFIFIWQSRTKQYYEF